MREAKTTRRYAAKLVGLSRRDATPVWVLIHVEVQGDAETDFAERMFTYHDKIRDVYQVPVASLAVLADADSNFRPHRCRAALWDCRVEFQFPTVKLLDYAEPERWAELEASDNVFALVLMAQIRAKITDDALTGDVGVHFRSPQPTRSAGLGALRQRLTKNDRAPNQSFHA